MSLSIETKAAIAVATGFALMLVRAMAQGLAKAGQPIADHAAFFFATAFLATMTFGNSITSADAAFSF